MRFVFDEQEIRKAVAVLKPNGELFEIRYIPTTKNRYEIYSGYFTSADTLINELSRFEPREQGNLYFTLNKINQACYSRTQRDRFIKTSGSTSDNDIVGYQWLMIDFDPERPSDTSSSNDELEAAHHKAISVYRYLAENGFSEPLVAISGNGYHLLYRINLAVTDERRELVKRVLETLDFLFSDTQIKVDTTVHNPARICKLYGTYAAKGANTPDRPHRLARILKIPNEITPTPPEMLMKLTEQLPKEPESTQRNYHDNGNFNLHNWLCEHHINIRESVSYKGGTKYILECCPFDESHTGKDAAVFQLASGAVGFKCLHNSCSHYGWRDFREKFEPDAYKYDRTPRPERSPVSTPNRELPPIPDREKRKQDEPVFLTMKQIDELKDKTDEFIKTGITGIDTRIRGLRKGAVTILSGLRACGKSSFISQLALEAANQKLCTAIYSGEMSAKNVKKWLTRQAAGKYGVHKVDFDDGSYEYLVKPDHDKAVTEWLNKYVLVYNNVHSNDFGFILKALQKLVDENHADLIILDNLMTLNLSLIESDTYQRQSAFVGMLVNFAELNNVHIVLVAHPRKAQGFLRIEDISGSGDIANRAENIFIMHRVNDDFKRNSKQTLGWKESNSIYNASNDIEICKNRTNGVCDVHIPLYFDIPTKQLCNEFGEYRHYAWAESGVSADEDLF